MLMLSDRREQIGRTAPGWVLVHATGDRVTCDLEDLARSVFVRESLTEVDSARSGREGTHLSEDGGDGCSVGGEQSRAACRALPGAWSHSHPVQATRIGGSHPRHKKPTGSVGSLKQHRQKEHTMSDNSQPTPSPETPRTPDASVPPRPPMPAQPTGSYTQPTLPVPPAAYAPPLEQYAPAYSGPAPAQSPAPTYAYAAPTAPAKAQKVARGRLSDSSSRPLSSEALPASAVPQPEHRSSRRPRRSQPASPRRSRSTTPTRSTRPPHGGQGAAERCDDLGDLAPRRNGIGRDPQR